MSTTDLRKEYQDIIDTRYVKADGTDLVQKKEYRHIGKYVPRQDARDIVTGACVFMEDAKDNRFENPLYCRILGSPYAHAKIKDIDTTEAEAVPGVACILTYKNLPDWAKEYMNGQPAIKPIVDTRLVSVGDAVAVVAAETEDICREAIRLIKVEYEQLPAVFDPMKAMEPDAPVIYEEFGENKWPKFLEFGDERMLGEVRRGDCDKEFAEADAIGGGICGFETRSVPLAPEPPVAVMTWDERTRTYEMWAAAQNCHQLQMCPDVGGRMPHDLIIHGHTFHTGGSYGQKQEYTLHTLILGVLARHTHRPVKYAYTKEDQFLLFEYRIGSRMDIEFAIKDGIVTAVRGNWYADSGTIDDAGYCITAVGLGEMQLALAKCKAWDVDTIMAITNRSYSGTVRGFGGQELKSSMMPLVMDAVRKANIDPVEFILNNFIHAGLDYMWRDCKWYTCHEVDYRHMIKNAAEQFGWKDKWKGWMKPTAVNGPKRVGIGVSIHGNGDVGEDNSEALVQLRQKGNAIIMCDCTEFGNGQRMAIVKMVAEVLNISCDKVHVTPSNSWDNPEDFGLCGSRGTLTMGSAVTRAAEDALRQLKVIAADKLRISPDQVETEDGFLFPYNKPQNKISWEECIPYTTDIIGKGNWVANYAAPNCVINFVEVEVDVETGVAKILKLLSATDAGQVIDPKALEMQMQGGIGAAAIDTGLMEENILDEYTGRFVTGNLIDYKWRTFNDFPPMEIIMEESQPNISRFRAVGVGEISGAAGAAAIQMAVQNAIEVPYMEYPASPDNILKALGKI